MTTAGELILGTGTVPGTPTSGKASLHSLTGADLQLKNDAAAVAVILNAGRVAQLIPFSQGTTLSPVTTTNTTPFYATVDAARTIVSWVQSVYAAATNNGSHYWTVQLRNGKTGAVLTSFTTAAITADVWTRVDSGAISVAITTAMVLLDITCVKTGTPGNMYIAGPAVYAY